MFPFSCNDRFDEFSFNNKHFVVILWSFPAENSDVSSDLQIFAIILKTGAKNNLINKKNQSSYIDLTLYQISCF